MTAQTWEHRLLTWAYEALEDRGGARHGARHGLAPAPMLAHAYQYSVAVTAAHSRTFYLASGLLPAGKRAAARALYAFCRVTDDLVDRPGDEQARGLEEWRRRALAPHPAGDDPVALAFADARASYGIPRRYAEQLIEGVSRDLSTARYPSFDELAAYCYGVASTVGLMAMHIIGFAGPEAIPYAVRLGVALQLTNILRDVGEDYRAGRIYLPQDELNDFDLSEADIAQGRVTDRWRAFMRYQIARNRALYAEAAPGIGLLAADGRFAIGAAAGLYQAILDDIQAHDFDVFSRRAHVSAFDKLRRLPDIWWQARQPARPQLLGAEVQRA
jgi:phytoene synthase